MYSYQTTSQQQQHYSPPPPAEQQYAQPPYGQQPVNQGVYAGASQYASTSSSGGYGGQQSPPYGQQQHQPAPAYGADVSYGGYGQPAAPAQSPAPVYGSTSHAEYGRPATSPPPPPTHSQYQQHPQQHYQSAYSSPPPPAPYSQPPPPQPQLGPSLPYNIGTDQNVFRGYFSHELKQLTFNSKPMINGLTILAHEHATRMAPIVCQCLEEHVRQVRANCLFFLLCSFPNTYIIFELASVE